jgi:hypothetical protein
MPAKRARQKRLYGKEDRSVSDKGAFALNLLIRLNKGNHPERNPIRKLRLYEQYTHDLIDFVVLIMEIQHGLQSSLLLETPNERLAWTAEEDTFLVERRADDVSIHLIANDLGRTPAACATRLSTLTGIPRNQIVEAYIEGTLDHEQDIHGLFTGKVRKVTP